MLSFLIFSIVFIIGLISVLVYLYPGKKTAPSTVPGLDPSDKSEGNVADIRLAGSLHEFLLDLHEQFGAVASFWLGQSYIVSTASVDTFKSQMHLFNRPGIFYDLFRPLIGDTSVQFLNDGEGREARQKLDRYFSFEYCGKYIPIFVDIGKQVAREWEKLVETNTPIPLRHEFVLQAINVLKNQLKQVIRHRRMQDVDFDDKLMIDEIIAHFDNEEDIANNVVTYLVGGSHTTGNLLVWILYFLASNRECYQNVFEEIKQVCGDDDLWPAAVSDLKYTRQVIDETMRITALGNFAARVSSSELVLEGHLIPANTPILSSIGSVCKNEEYWEEPDRFNPDRFADSEKVDILKCPSFGYAGKRKCPGYRFAYFEIYAMLSVLLRKFKITLRNPDQSVGFNYALVTTPSDEIFIDAQPI